MTHILVKDGRVVVQGGRVLTSQGGAPCCCGPGGCWLVVLPCNCDCPGNVRVIELTPIIDSVWPAESREAGSVIETLDGCYVLMGSTTDRPDAGEIQPESIIAVHDSCDAAPCTDPPCPDLNGFQILIGSCVGEFFTSCLARVKVRYRMRGYYRDVEQFGNGATRLEYSIQSSGEYEYVGNGSTPQTWSFTSTFKGTDDREAAGGSRRDWDIVQEIDQDTPGANASGITPNFASPSFMQAPSQPQSGLQVSDTRVSTDLFPDGGANLPCSGSYDSGGEPGVDTVWTLNNASSGQPTSVSSFTAGTASFAGENQIRTAFSTSIRIVEIELVDGTILEFDQCDEPQPSIATACDAEAEPQEITYDAQLIGPYAVTILDPVTDQVYIPTTLPSSNPPIGFVEIPEGCPEPPNPTGDIYRINRCNSTQQAIGAQPNGDGPPTPVTIGYRPAEGMNPGEGHIRYRGVAGPRGCLYSLAGQPTTEVLTEEPNLILTSRPGSCLRQVTTLIDTRPECLDDDQPGGGGGPTSNPAFTDPAVQAELDRQAMARSGQYPGRCPSCGG